MLFGVGYGSARSFIELAQQVGQADLVIDVRANPVSPGRPQFSSKALGNLFNDMKVAYTWIPELGNPFYRDKANGLARYAELLSGPSGNDIKAILESHANSLTALLCACAHEESCHRGVLLRHARSRGLAVRLTGET